MFRYINLKGKRFNRLIVIEEWGRNIYSRVIWKCKCDCGNIVYIESYKLTSNHTKSCGCLVLDSLTKHGFAKTKFYKIWTHLKNRCNNQRDIHYEEYGGRGIIYDNKWENFLGFKEDMYFKYIYAKKLYGEKCLSIERLDVNGNYCFNNCLFIPKNKQLENTRKSNRYICCINKFTGKKIITNKRWEFIKEYNLDSGCVSKCLSKDRKYHKDWEFKYL